MRLLKLIILLLVCWETADAQTALDTLRYGAAYYYEYMPQERLEKDAQLMKQAGINTVRIAESTWSVWEPTDGKFDFSKLDRVLDVMERTGIDVIVGTPTYAIPAWLAREHPEVLVTSNSGRRQYGPRQNMDIVSPVFRFYAGRIIRQLITHVRNRRCVIGYQTDNETKSYGNTGAPMQALFRRWLQQQWGSPEKMNRAYGLNYWSNSIHDWRDLPSMAGNINASLGCAFAAFQRRMVTEYLAWQAGIIRQLKRPDQFITQNFDLEWRGSSYGIQPDVDHFAAARTFDIAGIDIYHPTAARLTGAEIAFGGDLARGMRRANYLVMETQAQSLAGRQELPYPGQLRLQAFSHLASGADMVEYWPWQSLPNAVETYWKGVLSHDGEPNPVYEEVKQTGAEFRQAGEHLVHLRKHNKVALLFSNESLTALDWFPFSDSLRYNDILRREYDVLYSRNIGCDLVNTASNNFRDYSLIIVPPLYSVSDSLLTALNDYVRQGGHIVYSCKSGFTDEHVQVRPSRMPGPLQDAAGVSYQLFTNIGHVPLRGDPFDVGAAANEVHDWAEMLVPGTAQVLGWYDHPYWGKYAAITHNTYGKGTVIYMGTIPSREVLEQLLMQAVKEAGLSLPEVRFPLIERGGVNRFGREVHYYFNYSAQAETFTYTHPSSTDLLTNKKVEAGQVLTLGPWGVMIMESGGAGDDSAPGGDSAPGDEAGSRWLDTEGRPINAHGAGVLFHEGVYYLFGEIKKGPTRLVPGQGWEDYRVDAGGISCYSSRDLVHWKNEGVALAADTIDPTSDIHTSRVIERPNGQMSRDMTLFKDDDGRAYLVYASENNNTMQVCLLSKDYLTPTSVYKRILIGQRREAPAIFKQESKYYLITSLCTGWDPNPAAYAVADSMLGSWEQRGNPCVGAAANTTFHSQSTFVLPLRGGGALPAKNGFLFMADRWNKMDLEHSGYLWLPLRVEEGKVEIKEEAQTDTICRRMTAAQLSIVNYKLRIKARTNGYSFLRCYDSSGKLLLEYKMPFRSADTTTGNYTETPAGTSYLTIGVCTAGLVSVDDVQLELNPGEKRHLPLCNIDQYLQPFWKGDTVYNETVLLRTDGAASAGGKLLYQPDKVLAVTNYGLDTVYREGVDYVVNGRTLLRRPGSLMPFRLDSSFDRSNLAWYNLQGQWVTVTYTHHDRWPDPTPAFQGSRIPRLMDRLRTGLPVTIVSYGMSITRGMDVSGYDGVAPYMPTYMELFAHGLRRRWPRSAVTLYNAGLPGATVDWGAKYAAQYINPLRPDLVVIDFGMNDFWRMPPAEFRDSIQKIVHTVRSAWPATEFLLLSNMKFDPDYVLDSDVNKVIYTGNLAGYHDMLKGLEAKGIIGLDMTNLSDAVYRRKKARDCIVNPLHPNDYLARWYAQGMIALLCP